MSRSRQLAADLLAIDVGNSKVQAILLRQGKECWRWHVTYGPPRNPWQRPWAQALRLAWRQMDRSVPILMASVSPAKAAVIDEQLRRAGARRVHPVSWRDPWPFRLSLAHPDTVGADRLANVAGLAAMGLKSGVAIDAGTAVTIDVLRQGRFVGGLILPGPALMSEALHAHTALLPRVAWRGPAVLIGDDTESALRAGIVHGWTQAIAGILRKLRSQLGSESVMVVTGGQATDVAAAIPGLRVEPDLMFQGLRLLAAALARRRRPREPRGRSPKSPGKKRG
jgi:type III pantothenate kinase